MRDLIELLGDRGMPILTDRFGVLGLDARDLRLGKQTVRPEKGLTLWSAMLHYDATGTAERFVSVLADLMARKIPPGTENARTRSKCLAECAEFLEPVEPFLSETFRIRGTHERKLIEQYIKQKNMLELSIQKMLCCGDVVATGYCSEDALNEPPQVINADRWRCLRV